MQSASISEPYLTREECDIHKLQLGVTMLDMIYQPDTDMIGLGWD